MSTGGRTLAKREISITADGRAEGLPEVLELDEALRFAVVDVRTAGGTAPRFVEFMVDEGGVRRIGSPEEWSRIGEGPLCVPFHGNERVGWVAARGHVPVRLRLRPGGRPRVVLEEARVIRVRVVGERPPGFWRLVAAVRFEDGSLDRRLPSAATLDMDARGVPYHGEVEFAVPLAGAYVVCLVVESDGGRALVPGRQALTVRDGPADAVQTFEIPLDAALVRVALAKVGDR